MGHRDQLICACYNNPFDLCIIVVIFLVLLPCYLSFNLLQASFVLCRIFVKSRGGKSKSEVSLSSGAGESVSAVRHIGIQHDGFLIPDSSEGKVDDDNSIDRRNDTCIYPVRLVSQLDGHVTSRPVSDASFQFPAGIPSKEQVIYFKASPVNLYCHLFFLMFYV